MDALCELITDKETIELKTRFRFKYPSIIEIMLFVCVTYRVDVECAISILSKHANYPSEHYFCSAQELIVYLMQTKTKSLIFKCPKDNFLENLLRENNIFRHKTKSNMNLMCLKMLNY